MSVEEASLKGVKWYVRKHLLDDSGEVLLVHSSHTYAFLVLELFGLGQLFGGVFNHFQLIDICIYL